MAWLTNYDERPWKMLVRLHKVNREARVVMVDVIALSTTNPSTEAELQTHVVAYQAGAFVSRRLTNVTP